MKTLMLCAVVGLGSPGLLRAAEGVAQNSGGPAALVTGAGVQTDGPPQDWGATSRCSVTYVAHAFEPVDSGVTYNFTPFGNLGIFRTNATGNPWVEAAVNLPNGALVEAAEFRFCDTSATRSFASFLTINDKAGSVTQPVLVTSTTAENIGCVVRTVTLTPPITVDNSNNAYSLEANLGGTGTAGDNTIILDQARLYYRLQVSPAPATATFGNDVPTSHPFFRFVEAMAASGLTGGCAPNAFCPDQPVTRGQMAVFLSTALGLHFPN